MNNQLRSDTVFAFGASGSFATITLSHINACVGLAVGLLSGAFVIWQWAVAYNRLKKEDALEEEK